MSGPIVRSGPSPEFSQNWEKIFGQRQPISLAGKPGKAPAKSKPAKAKPAPASKARSAKPKAGAKPKAKSRGKKA